MSDKNDGLKDLNYYIEHPDEMPTDPDTIAKIMDQDAAAGGGGGEPKADPNKDKDELKPDDPNKDKPAPASAAKPDAEPKVDGVLAKDGKNFLPYAELERRVAAARQQGEEQARAAIEAAGKEAVEKLQAQLKAKDEQIAQLDKGKKAEPDPIEGISEELLTTFREEYPTQAKIIEPILAAIKQRDTRISELTADLQSERQTRQKSEAEIAAEEVQALIGANADLDDWQKNRPMLFDLAVDQEAKLMSDKDWVAKNPELAKDDAKRYDHVVSLVKQAVGLPAASPKNEPDLDRKAQEALDGAQPQTPRSLSDIKGGSPPATNVEDNLEAVGADQLAAKLLSMDPASRERWFARLG